MHTPTFSSCLTRRLWLLMVIGAMIAISFRGENTPLIHASEPVEAGYRDFSYGTSTGPDGLPTGNCNSTPTGEKPESKLWWNDGFWWANLCNDVAQEHHIYRLDVASQSWMDTGTVLDDHPRTKADTLWDETNQKLYVAHLHDQCTAECQPVALGPAVPLQLQPRDTNVQSGCRVPGTRDPRQVGDADDSQGFDRPVVGDVCREQPGDGEPQSQW